VARFPFLSRRVTAPIVNRRLRVEALEDRSVPATVFADARLVLNAPLTGTLATLVTNDRDSSGTLTPGDQVTLTVNGSPVVLTYARPAISTDTGTAFGKIQPAVGFAGTGDTVDVLAGTYNETVDVTRAVNLMGVGATPADVTLSGLSLAGTAGADTFTVTGTGVQVSSGSGAPQTVAGITFNALTLNGSAGADTFDITPSAAGGPVITVNGNLPGPTAGQGTAGDVLTLSGATGTTFSNVGFSPGGFAGTASFTNAADVQFTGIERLTNGATISGMVFNDTDGSGTLNGAETGLAGVTVGLDVNGNGTADLTTSTDANGNYSFAGLIPGAYRVVLNPAAGTTLTTTPPAPVTVPLGGTPRA
jgi:hypothetical protein